MSPRIALTTACSGAPSKLKVDSPLVAAMPGRGSLAAAWLMVWPLPSRTCACGSSMSSPIGSACTPGGGGACSVPERCSSGIGVAHAASRRARVAASAVLIRLDGFIECTLRVLPRRCRRLRLLFANARPARFDPAPDCLGLRGRGDVLFGLGFGLFRGFRAGVHDAAVGRRLAADAVEHPQFQHPL